MTPTGPGDRPTTLTEALDYLVDLARDRGPSADVLRTNQAEDLLRDFLAARTPTATGDDLRDRVTALADRKESEATNAERIDKGYARSLRQDAADLRAAVSPAPVVSRPEAEVKAEALRGIRWRIETACDGYSHLMDDDVPWDADADSYQRGAHDAAEAIRAVSFATDPEAGGAS